MGRGKSLEALYIENKLQKNPDLRFDEIVKFKDYTYEFENSFFNAVKIRYKKSLLKTASEFSEGSLHNIEYSKEMRQLIPSLDPYFATTDTGITVSEIVLGLSRINNCNVRLVGPAGCGKTSFAIQYAATNQIPCLIMDCANVREPRDWFGYRKFDPTTKEIVWHESLFVKAIESPYSVIVLDELNRVSPMVVNTLIPLLDHRRATYLEEAQRQIVCAEGVTFWASINEGSQFTGTISLDEAIADRFGLVVECKFLPESDEKIVLHKRTGLDKAICEKLVDIANQVRIKAQMDGIDSYSRPISTRMLENVAKAFKVGGVKTLHYSLLNHFSTVGNNSSERANLLQLLVGKFGEIPK